MVLITSWPKTNWKGTFNTRNLILNRNLQWPRTSSTAVFCLSFGSQPDCILYLSVSCFNISCLLKYKPKIDFLQFAHGNVCWAITRSNPGLSPLCAEVYVGYWLKHKTKHSVFKIWHSEWILIISHGYKGPQFRVWTQRGDRRVLIFFFLDSPWWWCKISTFLNPLTLPPTLRLLPS